MSSMLSVSMTACSAWYRITRLPVSKILRAVAAQVAITAAIGTAVRLLSQPTVAEVRAPEHIWMPPIRAEAVPALRLNGARERAEELGNTHPWQQRKRKMRKMVLNSSKNPKMLPASRQRAVVTCRIRAIRRCRHKDRPKR
jgi:hypothetical protein